LLRRADRIALSAIAVHHADNGYSFPGVDILMVRLFSVVLIYSPDGTNVWFTVWGA